MPGQHRVDARKEAVARQERLGAAGLLGGRAEVHDRAGERARRDLLLDGDGGGQRAHAQQIVAAAVARAAGDEGVLHRAAGLLAQAAQRVKLAQIRDHRVAAAVFRAEGVGHAAEVFGEREAVLHQQLTEHAGGEILVKIDLRMRPDGVAGLGIGVTVRIDAGAYGLNKRVCVHGVYSSLYHTMQQV